MAEERLSTLAIDRLRLKNLPLTSKQNLEEKPKANEC